MLAMFIKVTNLRELQYVSFFGTDGEVYRKKTSLNPYITNTGFFNLFKTLPMIYKTKSGGTDCYKTSIVFPHRLRVLE